MKIAIIVGSSTAESSDILRSAQRVETTLRELLHTVVTLHWSQSLVDVSHCLEQLSTCHAAFPLVSGVEGFLEAIGVPYVGSDPTAAGIAANKGIFNDLLIAWGYEKTPYFRLRRHETLSESQIGGIKFPLFVKPARMGASLGIEVVNEITELEPAVARARNFDSELVIEQSVRGKEVEVAVISSTEIIVSEPGIVKLPINADWHDYHAKDISDIKVPGDLPYEITTKLKNMARDLTSKVGATGAVRFDFFLTGEGNILVGEINCLPGQSPTSNFPRLFEGSGYNLSEQMQLMLDAAVDTAKQTKKDKVKF